MVFASCEEILSTSLDQIFAQIDIDPEVINQFSSLYIQAHQSGSPRAEQQAAYDTISKTRWKWPEFEKWRAVFIENEQWPYTWKRQRLHEMPDGNEQQEEYWQQRIARILVHTITMRAYSLRDEQERIENRMQQRFAEKTDDVCEVEAEICRQYDAGELKGLPPFFPGDRTSLVDERYMEMLKGYNDL